ncbi:MAG: GNAT family N-acetyltransferase [Polyangia bacterium]
MACRHGTHFLHFPAWYGAELARSGEQGVHFLALRDSSSSELVAVLPLQRYFLQALGLKWPIVQLYYPNEMGVNEVLTREPLRLHMPAVRQLLSREVPFFWLMRWQCVLENGWAVTAAPASSAVRYLHGSKYLAFAQGYERFLEGLGAKLRSDLRKKRRRLEQMGQLHLAVHARAAELPRAFEQFLALEDSGWKGKRGTSLRRQPDRERYYRYLLEHYGRLGLCRINVLLLGETPIAGLFGIEVGDSLHLLKIGFAEELAPHSPGGILLLEMVQHLCRHSRVRIISFVTGARWCDRWRPSVTRVGVFYTGGAAYLSEIALGVMGRGLRWRDRRVACGASEAARPATLMASSLPRVAQGQETASEAPEGEV